MRNFSLNQYRHGKVCCGSKPYEQAGSRSRRKPNSMTSKGCLRVKIPQLGGVDQALLDADEARFEVGALRVSRASTRGTRSFPAFDHGPIKQGKKGAVLLDHWVMRHRRAAMTDWSKIWDEG